MPTLDELYQQEVIRRRLGTTTPAAPPPSRSWLEVFKGVDQMPKKIVDAMVPMASDVLLDTFPPTSIYRRLTETPEQFNSRLNTLAMGIPEQYNQRYNENIQRHGEPKTASEKIDQRLWSAMDVAMMDVLPGKELAENITGERTVGYNGLGIPQKQRVTDQEFGQNIVTGVLKGLPFMKGASGASKAVAATKAYNVVHKASGDVIAEFAVEGLGRKAAKKSASDWAKTSDALVVEAVIDPLKVARPETARRSTIGMTPSVGEIEAQTIMKTQPAKRVGQQPLTTVESEYPTGALQPIATEYADKFHLANQMSPTMIDSIASDVLQSDVLKRINLELGPGVRPTQKLAVAVQQGGLSEAKIGQIVQEYGLPDNELSSVLDGIASTLIQSETTGGQSLNAISKLSRQMYADTVLAAQRGDGAAIKYLRDMELFKPSGSGMTGAWHWAMNKFRSLESFRLAAVTSQFSTAMRNMVASNIIVRPMQLMESLVADMIEGGIKEGSVGAIKAAYNDGAARMRGVAKGVKEVGEDWADSVSNGFGLIGNAPTKAVRVGIEDVMDALPLTQHRMYQAHQLEAGSNVLANMAKRKLPVTMHNVVDGTKEAMGFFNRTQEIFNRKVAFQSRLEENLRAVGVVDDMGNGSFPKLMDELRKPELREDIRLAVADAETTSLLNTFALQPESGMWKAVMRVYKELPVLTALGPQFPRFLANQWMFLTERSPTHWFAMFNPEFRSQLTASVNSGMASRAAARQMGQAMSGAMMLATAYALRSSEQAGPKYYQFKSALPMIAGKTPGKGEEYLDMRPYSPFDKFLAAADSIYRVSKGLPINLDPNELIDLSVGLRRISESPIFGLSDILRSFESSDPEVVRAAVTTPAGQYLASFFTPLQGIKEVVGGITGDKSLLERKDVEGQELYGPALSLMPKSPLPARVDPFTSEPVSQARPLIRQLAGVTTQKMTQLQEIIAQTPGVNVNELTSIPGAGQEANSLIAKHMGKLLDMPTAEGRTISDDLVKNLQGLDDLPRKERIQKIFSDLRRGARAYAESENPAAFRKYRIKQSTPPSEHDITNRYVDYLFSPKEKQ